MYAINKILCMLPRRMCMSRKKKKRIFLFISFVIECQCSKLKIKWCTYKKENIVWWRKLWIETIFIHNKKSISNNIYITGHRFDIISQDYMWVIHSSLFFFLLILKIRQTQKDHRDIVNIMSITWIIKASFTCFTIFDSIISTNFIMIENNWKTNFLFDRIM